MDSTHAADDDSCPRHGTSRLPAAQHQHVGALGRWRCPAAMGGKGAPSCRRQSCPSSAAWELAGTPRLEPAIGRAWRESGGGARPLSAETTPSVSPEDWQFRGGHCHGIPCAGTTEEEQRAQPKHAQGDCAHGPSEHAFPPPPAQVVANELRARPGPSASLAQPSRICMHLPHTKRRANTTETPAMEPATGIISIRHAAARWRQH